MMSIKIIFSVALPPTVQSIVHTPYTHVVAVVDSILAVSPILRAFQGTGNGDRGRSGGRFRWKYGKKNEENHCRTGAKAAVGSAVWHAAHEHNQRRCVCEVGAICSGADKITRTGQENLGGRVQLVISKIPLSL